MQPPGGPIAEVDQFVRDWSAGVLSTGPLADAERAAVTDAVRRCYAHAGLRWPGRVVWAPSPPAGQALADDLARRHTAAAVRARTAARLALRWAWSIVAFGLAGALLCAVLAFLLMAFLPGDPVLAGAGTPSGSHHGRGAWIGGVIACLVVVAVLAGLFRAYVRDDGSGFGVVDGTFADLAGAVLVVLMTAFLVLLLGSAIGRGVGGGGPVTWTWIQTLLTATLAPVVVVIAVFGAVVRGVGNGLRHVRDRAHGRLGRRLGGALTAIGDAVPAGSGTDAWVPIAVDELSGAVVRSVEAAVRSATSGAGGGRRILRYRVGYFGDTGGDRLVRAAWLAASGAPVPAGAARVVADFVAASRAGWWWPHTGFVVIGERPSALRVDSGRLHSTDAPAAEWPDGYLIHAVHGTIVPGDLIEHGWDLDQIRLNPNSEVRRAAIERMGWAVYIERAGWELVATAPDPGNPPHELALYADPGRLVGDVRVLVMTNGSPDRTGEQRRYAETVPDWITDPVEAAAWQYDCPVEVYRQLQRRT